MVVTGRGLGGGPCGPVARGVRGGGPVVACGGPGGRGGGPGGVLVALLWPRLSGRRGGGSGARGLRSGWPWWRSLLPW